jgi:hypothetical protein
LTLPSADWLPLLRRLTHISDSWGVWKNAERALAGQGDVDSVAPAAEHGLLRVEFCNWAVQAGLQWVIQCHHAGGILVLIGVDHSSWAQLDLVSASPFRGARLFSAEDLVPLMVMDPRGFRRIRVGAEGLFLFLYKGLRWGGRPDWSNLTKYKVLDKIAGDWAGTEAAAELLGPARGPLLRAARFAVNGEWKAMALLNTEALTLTRALTDPGMVVSRAITRGWKLQRCIVARTIAAGRRPERLGEWLHQASRHHAVQQLSPFRANPGS